LRYRSQRTEDRRQWTEGLFLPSVLDPPVPAQSLQHLGELLIFVPPPLPHRRIDIAKIKAIAEPHPHFLARPDRHHQEPLELRRRVMLLGIPFGDVRADRLARPADLIGKSALLDRWKCQARMMDLKRHAIGPPKDLQVLERGYALSPALHLSSVICILSSGTRSFGTWLEPRYIFGAGRLT